MPAIGNIVVNDAETTPVAHTFAPVTTDGSLAKLANRTATTPSGFETMKVEVRPPNGNGGAHRVILGMGDPTEVTVDGVVSIDRVNSFEFTFNLSQKSTAQERKNILKMASNLLNHATIVAVVENVEPIY
jgi:hypothetical protein